MTVFGVEGIDIGEVLEAAAGVQWEPQPISPCGGTEAARRWTRRRVESACPPTAPARARGVAPIPGRSQGVSACGRRRTVVAPESY